MSCGDGMGVQVRASSDGNSTCILVPAANRGTSARATSRRNPRPCPRRRWRPVSEETRRAVVEPCLCPMPSAPSHHQSARQKQVRERIRFRRVRLAIAFAAPSKLCLRPRRVTDRDELVARPVDEQKGRAHAGLRQLCESAAERDYAMQRATRTDRHSESRTLREATLDVEVLATDCTWLGDAEPCAECAATCDGAGFAFPPGRDVEALDARRSLGPACRVWTEGMGCTGCETCAASLAPARTFRDVDRGEDGCCAKP